MNNNNWNIDAAHTGINFSVRHMVVSKVLEAGGILVGDRVEIELDVQAVKAPAAKVA